MDDRTKFILALMQIDNISTLVKDNEYEQFMVSHLTLIRVEIERQLSNLKGPNPGECDNRWAGHQTDRTQPDQVSWLC